MKTVRKILTEDLNMRKVCAKMVPKELTEEEKQRRVTSYVGLPLYIQEATWCEYIYIYIYVYIHIYIHIHTYVMRYGIALILLAINIFHFCTFRAVE
jgi:hypothetical protein